MVWNPPAPFTGAELSSGTLEGSGVHLLRLLPSPREVHELLLFGRELGLQPLHLRHQRGGHGVVGIDQYRLLPHVPVVQVFVRALALRNAPLYLPLESLDPEQAPVQGGRECGTLASWHHDGSMNSQRGRPEGEKERERKSVRHTDKILECSRFNRRRLPPNLQPPSVTLHPPSVSLQAPWVTHQPPLVTLQPSSLTLQPPSITLQPPSMTLQPPSAPLQGPSAPLQGPSVNLQPSSVTEPTHHCLSSNHRRLPANRLCCPCPSGTSFHT